MHEATPTYIGPAHSSRPHPPLDVVLQGVSLAVLPLKLLHHVREEALEALGQHGLRLGQLGPHLLHGRAVGGGQA